MTSNQVSNPTPPLFFMKPLYDVAVRAQAYFNTLHLCLFFVLIFGVLYFLGFIGIIRVYHEFHYIPSLCFDLLTYLFGSPTQVLLGREVRQKKHFKTKSLKSRHNFHYERLLKSFYFHILNIAKFSPKSILMDNHHLSNIIRLIFF